MLTYNQWSDLDLKQENNVIHIESLFNFNLDFKNNLLYTLTYIRLAIDNTHKWLTRHQIRNLVYDKDFRHGNPDYGDGR